MDKMVEAVLIGRLDMARKIFMEVSIARVWMLISFALVGIYTITHYKTSHWALWVALFFMTLAYLDIRRVRSYLVKAFGLQRLWGDQALAEKYVTDKAQEQMDVMEKLERKMNESSHQP